MRWCCLGFESHVKTAGSRGVSIIGGQDSQGNPEIFLQFRSIDSDLDSQLPNLPFPLSLATDIRIMFCPWCGKKVDEHYGSLVGNEIRSDLRVTH